jgi:hypothetical protein
MLDAASILDKEWRGVPRPLTWRMQNAIQVPIVRKFWEIIGSWFCHGLGLCLCGRWGLEWRSASSKSEAGVPRPLTWRMQNAIQVPIVRKDKDRDHGKTKNQ